MIDYNIIIMNDENSHTSILMERIRSRMTITITIII